MLKIIANRRATFKNKRGIGIVWGVLIGADCRCGGDPIRAFAEGQKIMRQLTFEHELPSYEPAKWTQGPPGPEYAGRLTVLNRYGDSAYNKVGENNN